MDRKTNLQINDEAVERACAVLSENFPNWAMVVVTEDDELYIDWSSIHVAEGLFKKGLKSFEEADLMDIDWDDDEMEDWYE